jgi:hypothetical protein
VTSIRIIISGKGFIILQPFLLPRVIGNAKMRECRGDPYQYGDAEEELSRGHGALRLPIHLEVVFWV